MRLGLLLGFLAFVLFLAIRHHVSRPEPSTAKQKLKLLKVLVAAMLAWMAVNMRLTKLNQSLDGKPPAPPTAVEKFLERH